MDATATILVSWQVKVSTVDQFDDLYFLSIHSYATVSINDEVIVFGGYVGRYGEVATIGKLDHSRQWVHLGQLLERRHGHAATIANSNVLIIGGEGKR